MQFEKLVNKHRFARVVSFLILVFLGLFSFSWIFARKDVLAIGHGMSLDGLRNYFLLLTVLIAFAFSTARTSRIEISREVGAIALFVFFAVLTSIYALNSGYAIRDSIKLAYPLILYSVARTSFKDMKSIFAVLNGLIWILGTLVLLTAGTTLIALRMGWYDLQTSGLAPSRIGDLPNTYSLSSGPTVLFMLLLIGRLFYLRKGLLITILMSLVASTIVIITITRSYIIGMVMAVVALLWTRARGGLLYLIAGVLAMYTIFILAITKVELLSQRMFWSPETITFWGVFSNPTILLSEEWVRTSGRNSIWTYMISELHAQGTSLLGGGIGSTKFILMGGQIFKGTTVAHGDFAKYFAELGYIGISIFAAMIIYVMYSLYRNIHRSSTREQAYINAVLFSAFSYNVTVSYGYEVFGNGFEYTSMLLVLFALRDNLYEVQRAEPRSRGRE